MGAGHSLLFQTGFSGRLEVGLIGDDDLTVKVSPDGSAWTEALRIDKGSGAVLLNGALTVDLSAGALPAPLANTGLHLKGTPNSAVRLFLDTMGNDTGDAPNVAYRWARNSAGNPAAAQSGDILGVFSWFGYGATGYSAAARAQMRGVAAESWTDSAQGTRLVFLTSPIGAAAASERFAVEADGGLSMGGSSNVVVDQNRNFRRRIYTIATLPTPTSGLEVQVSDLGGGAGPLIGDGTGWLHDGQGGQAAVATDAAFTLTPLSSAPKIKHTGTLTANRLVTRSTTNARPGSVFEITRTGGGGFNLDIGGLKDLAQNTWCKVVFDGAAWYLAACGTL